jgi:hypothetical protein
VGHLELKNLSENLFFSLPSAMSEIYGLVIYHWKGLENTFPTVYYTLQKVLKLQLKNKKIKYVIVE